MRVASGAFVHCLAVAWVLVGCTTPPVGPDKGAGAQPTAKREPDAGTADPPAKANGSVDAPEAEVDPSGGYAATDDLYYQEIVTGGADPDAALPMIVAIHGLGDEPRNFAGLLAGLPVQARVILPRAIDDHEVGWSWFPVRARDPDVEALAKGIVRAADTVDAGVRRLEVSRPTLGKPIVTGFSQGGMLTFALAVRHPDHYAAAIPVGGWLPPPLWPEALGDAAPPPIVALHGDADPAVKIQPTRDAVAKLDELGANAALHEYPGIGHMIPPDMRTELHQLLVDAVKRVRTQAEANPDTARAAG